MGALRTSWRILPGCSSVLGSSVRPCRRASVRSVPAARSVPNGSVREAAQTESRPNSVRYHGVPAAAKASPGESGSREHQLGQVGDGVVHHQVEAPVRGRDPYLAPVDEVAAGVGPEGRGRGTAHRDVDGPVAAAAGRDVGLPDERADAVLADLGPGTLQPHARLVAVVAPGQAVAVGGHGQEVAGSAAGLDDAQLGAVPGRLEPQPAAQRPVPARDDRDLLAHPVVHQEPAPVHLDRRVRALVAEVAGHRHHPGRGAAAVRGDPHRTLAVGGQRPAGQDAAVVGVQAGAGRVQVSRPVADAGQVAVGRDLEVVQPGLAPAVLRSRRHRSGGPSGGS